MNKVDDLLECLECVKLARDMEPEPDALSLSLWAFGARLLALDDEGVNAESEVLGISPEAVREMTRAYAR